MEVVRRLWQFFNLYVYNSACIVARAMTCQCAETFMLIIECGWKFIAYIANSKSFKWSFPYRYIISQPNKLWKLSLVYDNSSYYNRVSHTLRSCNSTTVLYTNVATLQLEDKVHIQCMHATFQHCNNALECKHYNKYTLLQCILKQLQIKYVRAVLVPVWRMHV